MSGDPRRPNGGGTPVRVSPTSVLVGLISASGPPGALLSIGSSTSAQPELYVPITASTRWAFAYALAFAAHLRGSHEAACLVESSQDKSPIAYLPALTSCPATTARIVAAIARGASPVGPCSGRPAAISTPSRPAGDSSWHPEAGSVPARVAPAVLTHADPAPAAS